jgi:hypothetical protein
MVPFATRMIASRLTSALCHKAANYYRPAAKIETNMGGAWRETVVAVVTEFGRTARINGTNGTTAPAPSSRVRRRLSGIIMLILKDRELEFLASFNAN